MGARSKGDIFTMANRYYTDNPQRKITSGKAKGQAAPGSTPSIDFKEGPFPGCPGPSQPRDRSMGVKKVKTNNSDDGL